VRLQVGHNKRIEGSPTFFPAIPIVLASPPPASAPAPARLMSNDGNTSVPPLDSLELLPMAKAVMSTMMTEAFPAENAFDGDVGSLICTDSAKNSDQWLSMEVPHASAIGWVGVYNRGDAKEYRDWLNPYEIWTGPDRGVLYHQCGGEQMANVSSGVGPFMTNCGNATGPWVTLVLRAGTPRYLAISEMQIYGSDGAPHAAWAHPKSEPSPSPDASPSPEPSPSSTTTAPAVEVPKASPSPDASPSPESTAVRVPVEVALLGGFSSSQHDNFPPSNLVDGDLHTLASTEEALSEDQWLSVQVPPGIHVDDVVVYNRDDDTMYAQWLAPYEVWLGNTAGAREFNCGMNLQAPAAELLGPFQTSCGGASDYQFVTIYANAGVQRWLTLGEIKVYTLRAY